MNYWTYDDGKSGTVHKENCGAFKLRSPEALGWHGPYATKGAAYDAIEALDWKVWNCGNCRPISISQMTGGEEVSVG